MANVTLTINPIPSDSTVTLTATGYTQVNNSITVPEGTEVTYTVSRTDYATVSGTYTPYTTLTLNITLVRPQVDVNKVMENVAELLTNSVELTDKFYDIFFNPEPQDVTFLHYDNNDQLVEVTIPNRAQDTASIAAVSGSLPAINTCASNISSIQAAPSAAEIATQQAALAKQYAEETHGQSDVMVENVRALPAYKNYASTQTESTGLADIREYAHSTYDSSKFTVVGSPVITDNGIASGFSTSNYIKGNVTVADTDTFEVKIKFQLSSLPSSWTKIWGIYFGGSSQVYITSTSITFNWSVGGTNYYSRINYSFTGTESITYTFGWNGTQIYSQAIINETIYAGTTVALTTSNSFSEFYLANKGTTDGVFDGSIDLKQFSIRVDDKPIFSGNKTGIDQIKANNYTTVGTPTISNDGIASGFSTSNYLSIPNGWTSTQHWEITFKFTTNTISSDYGVFDFGGWNYVVIGSSTMSFRFNNGLISIPSQANSTYEGSYGWDGTQLYLKYKLNGVEQTTQTVNLTTSISISTILLGKFAQNDWTFNGSIDLNSVKIYVDDNLVCQATLCIPYTQTKTGLKVVDEYYRDRVDDMYSQYGWANYYTLQDGSKGNYNVIGSPTISDFVVSGCNASNYIKLPIFSTEGNDFKFSGTYITPSTLPTSNFMIIGGNNSYAYGAFQIYCNVVGNYMNATCFVNNNGTSVSLNFNVPITWAVDTSYDFYFEKSGTTYTFGAKKTSDTSYTTRTDTSSYPLYDTAQEVVGFYNGFAGSVDLKQFKVYANNALIYEGVLGANFTVPQGENLDGHVAKIDWYKNGLTSWEYDTNLDCIETGSCTSGTAVTLPKAMADTNYSLSVPYSAKTATGFTPTQTGEYIAKGKITLG